MNKGPPAITKTESYEQRAPWSVVLRSERLKFLGALGFCGLRALGSWGPKVLGSERLRVLGVLRSEELF